MVDLLAQFEGDGEEVWWLFCSEVGHSEVKLTR